MRRYNYPTIVPTSREIIIDKIQALAKAYTPQWRFNKENPDIGSTIALIYADLLKESTDIINQSLYKHHLAFLNCLETNIKPAIPAKSYVAFEVTPTYEEGVMIQKGTKLIGKGEEDVQFVTTHSVYASHVVPSEILYTSRERDCLIQAYDGERLPEEIKRSLFDFNLENLQSHALYIAHPFLLDGTVEGVVNVSLVTEMGSVQEEDIVWYLLGREGWQKLKSYKEGKVFILKIKDVEVERQTYEATDAYWFKAEIQSNPRTQSMSISKIELNTYKTQIQPQIIYANELESSAEGFLVFGKQFELYSECYIDADEVLSKKGAYLTLQFDLDYKLEEKQIEQEEEVVQFKFFMKKPIKKRQILPKEIKADEVIWEYFNGTGWVRLELEVGAKSIFNGQNSGRMQLQFKCPKDAERLEVGAYNRKWLRLRLLRAEHIYAIPAKEYLPFVSNLTWEYQYANDGLDPSQIMIKHNKTLQEVKNKLIKGISVPLVECIPFNNPSVFIGFKKLPKASPFCLFFEIENNSIQKTPHLKFTYSSEKNGRCYFENLKVSDETKSFKQTGNIMLILPKKFQKTTLFSKERYWIKIENDTGEYDAELKDLPFLKGIHMNTAKVVNETEKEETYFMNQTLGEKTFILPDKNIIELEVYINEKPVSEEETQKLIKNPEYNVKLERDFRGDIINLWVKWPGVSYKSDLKQGERGYYFDFMTGEVSFGTNIFTVIPVRTEREVVHIKYKMCQGTLANVEKGAIDALGQHVPFIQNVYNPIAAFGSGDFETVEDATKRISKFIGHREKLVTKEDYENVIKDYSSMIKSAKCFPNYNRSGEKEVGSITIAILTKDYEKGPHSFLAYKEHLEKYILEHSDLTLLSHKLYLIEPVFIKLQVRVWLKVDKMERAYEYQRTINEALGNFLNPLTGYFDYKGWEIGNIPKAKQLIAYINSLKLDCKIQNMILTAFVPFEGNWIEKELVQVSKIPFGIPISGNHEVIIKLVEE